jgi:phage FluMu protein Com
MKIIINGEQYREVRCERCKSYICYERDVIGIIAHKCSKCGFLNEIKLTMLETKANKNKIQLYLVNKIQ